MGTTTPCAAWLWPASLCPPAVSRCCSLLTSTRLALREALWHIVGTCHDMQTFWEELNDSLGQHVRMQGAIIFCAERLVPMPKPIDRDAGSEFPAVTVVTEGTKGLGMVYQSGCMHHVTAVRVLPGQTQAAERS